MRGDNSIVEYYYDTKRNPFSQFKPLNCNNIDVLLGSIGTVNDAELWYNKHNLTEIRYGTGTLSTFVFYEYTYNSDSYPATKTFDCEVEETTHFSYE